MSFMPINPRPMLQELVGKPVAVRLKWGETEYKGALVSIDSYMNLQLSDTEEYIDGESTGQLGQVLIRVQPGLRLCDYWKRHRTARSLGRSAPFREAREKAANYLRRLARKEAVEEDKDGEELDDKDCSLTTATKVSVFHLVNGNLEIPPTLFKALAMAGRIQDAFFPDKPNLWEQVPDGNDDDNDTNDQDDDPDDDGNDDTEDNTSDDNDGDDDDDAVFIDQHPASNALQVNAQTHQAMYQFMEEMQIGPNKGVAVRTMGWDAVHDGPLFLYDAGNGGSYFGLMEGMAMMSNVANSPMGANQDNASALRSNAHRLLSAGKHKTEAEASTRFKAETNVKALIQTTPASAAGAKRTFPSSSSTSSSMFTKKRLTDDSSVASRKKTKTGCLAYPSITTSSSVADRQPPVTYPVATKSTASRVSASPTETKSSVRRPLP
ncbi:hypothetical protein SBRCBS47491_000311 [Sporothrix bragantina]|uniref:Sm protein F n=1 Tax=Sporothrix bragantina TaxID=671064 RepID=A0ABP0AP77_9PEZI